MRCFTFWTCKVQNGGVQPTRKTWHLDAPHRDMLSAERNGLLMRSVKSSFLLLLSKVTKIYGMLVLLAIRIWAEKAKHRRWDFIVRSVSATLGEGCFTHNDRSFTADNVDGSRTHLNIAYCNEPIKEVYHKLFDKALEKYNAKQMLNDRKIANYYEKIRTSKQEKLFHEIIIQVGTPSPPRKSWMNILEAFGSATIPCTCSPRTCIWTRQRRICTLTLFPLPRTASEGWK